MNLSKHIPVQLNFRPTSNSVQHKQWWMTPELLQVLEEASKALSWLHEKQEAQAQLAKTDVPLLTAADIKKRQDTLQRVAEPIMSRPAPPPPVKHL